MKFLGFIECFNEGLYGMHIVVPEDIAEPLINSPYKRRVVVTFNGGPKQHQALFPGSDSQWYLIINAKIQKSHHLFLNDEVNVTIESDKSEYGMPMPDELRELMNDDPTGDELFHSLTPGTQRTLMHIIAKVKASHLRERKSWVILEHLKNHPKLDYKALMAEMKEANQKNI